MKMITQSNRQTLRRICKLGQIAGWVVIAVGFLEVGSYAYAHLVAHVNAQPTFYQSMVAASNILTGLLVLTTAQFVRYVVEEDTEPGWFLRNGHVIVGFFALYLFLTGSLYGWPQVWMAWELVFHHLPEQMILLDWLVASAEFAFLACIGLLPPITKALCVLGVAAMLRTVLPILAESKTLA